MRLRYLIEKEFKQMMRNILLPVLFIILPIGMINMMPRAANQEVKGLKYCVIDHDHSTFSGRMIQKISASQYFSLTANASTYEEALQEMEAGNADFIIEIEPDFERLLIKEGVAKVMISANAVNGVKGGLGQSYLTQIIADFAAQLREEQGLDGHSIQLPQIEASPRYLFNTRLDYKVFMVPGLMAMLLILLVGFLPALNIVGEKEKGTIEQINVTPIGRFEFIFSKLIPYWVVGLFIMAYSMLLAKGIYGLVPAGNIGLLLLFASLFILVVSCFGLLVSNYSETTQQAALVMLFFLIIFILTSGLITPISSMPRWAQTITYLNPLRYFIEVLRAIYLKGSGFTDLTSQFVSLCIYAGGVWIWAIRSYKKNNQR